MKTTITLIFFLLFYHYSHAQNQLLRVQYLENHELYGYQFINDLILYENYSKEIRNLKASAKVLPEAFKSALNSKRPYVLIKDYLNKTILTNVLYGKLADTIQHSWTLLQGSKIVLGYDCKKASTKFRGRDYVAYYCTSIPISNGPYKFQGLPGLILEIYSTDKFIHYTALNIFKKEKGLLEIKKDWYNDTMSYATFQKKKNEEIEELYRKTESRLPPEQQGQIKFSIKTEEIEND
ncbi:GLPGLI family protein [Aquirufa sp. ROCK-SH2]